MTRLFPVVLALTFFAAIAPAPAQVVLNERRPGLYGACTDMSEQPLEGCVVTLTPVGSTLAPLTIESNKRGLFTFPTLELVKDGYEMSAVKEGYFVRKFTILTRTGKMEIWQDIQGELVPDHQQMPAVRYRSGNANVRLFMMPIDEYQAQRQAKAAEEAAAQAASRPAPVVRELTPAEQAQEALAMGDFNAASQKLEAALLATPDDVEMRWLLAQTLARRQEWGGALREGMKVLRAQPDRPGANLDIARWLDQQGQPMSAAIPYLEKERALDAANVEVHKRLVAAYTDAGRKPDARAALDAWLAAHPEDSEALIALAAIKSEEGKFAEAEDLFQRVAAADPTNAHTMFFNAGASIMSRSSLTAEDRKRAAAAFRKAVELDPNYARAHLELAYVLIGLGDKAGAREHFQKFLDLAPGDPRAGEAKGMIEALRG